jgi:hypothetical protein
MLGVEWGYLKGTWSLVFALKVDTRNPSGGKQASEACKSSVILI